MGKMGKMPFLKGKKGKGPDEEGAAVAEEGGPDSTKMTDISQIDPNSFPIPEDNMPQIYSTNVSPWGSRPASIFPQGDFRNSSMMDLDRIRADVIINGLSQQQHRKLWSTGQLGEGIILRQSKGIFACAPPDLEEDEGGLFDAIRTMNVGVSGSL